MPVDFIKFTDNLPFTHAVCVAPWHSTLCCDTCFSAWVGKNMFYYYLPFLQIYLVISVKILFKTFPNIDMSYSSLARSKIYIET